MPELVSDKVTKPETSLPKEQVKKIAASLKELERKPNAPDRVTTRESFLRKANAEKDPKKRRAIISALKGRMFQ